MAYDDDIIAFIKARLDEDEAAATAATPGPWRAPCGPDDDSAVIEGRDGHVVADSHSCPDHPHRGAADALHIIRHGPARTLREVEAGRLLVGQYERLLQARDAHDEALAEWKADIEEEGRAGMWAGAGDPGTRSRALGREADYLNAMQPVLRGLVAAKAAVYSDHPDYDQEWKP